jgi:hypothetical protein
MTLSEINETSVLHAARAVNLEIDPAHLPGVVHYYRMVAGFAALVAEFPLDEHDEPAAVFSPCLSTTRV